MTSHNGSTSTDREAAEADARRKHLTVSVGLVLLASIVYVGVALFTLPDLPGMMATHFDATGRADGFMPTRPALLMQGAFVIGVPVALLLVLVAGQAWRGANARAFSATLAGLTAGLTTLFVSSTVIQVGVTDAADVTLRGSVALLALGVAALVGLASALVLPRPLPRRAAEVVVPMTIGPSDRVSWFGRAHMSQGALAMLALSVLVVALAAMGSGIAWLWLLVLLLVILVLGMTSFAVTIDGHGVSWRAALGVPRGRVKLTDITAVAVTEVSFGDFGGFGVRALPGRLGLITRSGSALQVTHGKRELVITVDDAHTAASVVEGLRRARG